MRVEIHAKREIGANIGACTVELLLRTRASIIALEPSPTNYYFLTRSLHALAQRHPEMARRVVVLPVGTADVSCVSVIDVLAIRIQQVSVSTYTQAARLSCEPPSKSD